MLQLYFHKRINLWPHINIYPQIVLTKYMKYQICEIQKFTYETIFLTLTKIFVQVKLPVKEIQMK